MREIAAVVVGGTPSTDVSAYWNGNIAWMASGDVHQKHITEVEGRITSLGLRSSNATLVEPPAVAVALAGQGKTRGTAAKVLTCLCTNQSVALITGKHEELHPDYLFHNLDSRYEELRARSSGGGRGGLSKGILEGTPLPVPDYSEQARIAEVLDTLDEAIGQSQVAVAKLLKVQDGLIDDFINHQDTSCIARVPLGEVCQKYGGSVQTGPFGSQLHAEDYRAEGIPIITVEHLDEGRILHKNLPLVGEDDYIRLQRYSLHTGDLVFSRVGAIDRCALVQTAEAGWLFSGRLLRVRVTSEEVNPAYLSLYLNAEGARRWIRNHAVGSTMACLNTKILGSVPISLPVRLAQDQIVAVASSIRASLDEEQLKLLKLHLLKQGLSSDLLTGRVRTRPH